MFDAYRGFRPAVVMALVAALVVAFLAWRLSYLKDQADDLRVQVAQLTATLEDANAVNAACNEATAVLKRLAQDQQDALRHAAERLRSLHDEHAAARARLQQLEDTDRADPDCDATLRLDLTLHCPGFADGVRQRAHRDLPRPGNRSPGARTDAAEPVPDRGLRTRL